MIASSHRYGSSYNSGQRALIITVTVVAVVFFGVAAAVLPWWLMIMAFVLPLLGIIAIVWPFLGLLGLVVLLSGMIPSGMLPQIAVGPGTIQGYDIALVMLIGLVVLKAAIDGNEALKASMPLFVPVLLFLLAIFPCSAVGYALFHTSAKEVLNEVRIHIYWLLFLMPLYFIRRPGDLNRIAWGFVLIGVILATMVIIQFSLGIRLLENSRVEDLLTLGTTYRDVTRSIPGEAISMIIFALYFLVARLLTNSLRFAAVLPLIVVLTAGIIATFGRGIWLSTVLGLCGIASYLGGGRALQRLLVTMFVGSLLAVTGLAAFKPAVIDAAAERFTSTFAEGKYKSSLGARLEENEFALKKIAASPILGIGFGTAYMPPLDPFRNWAQVYYIHNAYLGLWLKFGILGPIAAGWLVLVVVQKSRDLLRRGALNAETRALTTACLAAFLVPVVVSITQPEWLTRFGVSFFALMTGLIAALEYHFRPGELNAK